MDYFNINLPIFKLKDNKIIIPDSCNKIWIDVGTSVNCPNGTNFLRRNKDGFVLGFEPNPKSYFTIYSLYYINQNKWLIDNNHPTAKIEMDKRKKNTKTIPFSDNTEEFINRNDFMNRFIIVPCAISNKEGYSDLYFSKHEGSSSLNKNWSLTLNETFKVPTYPLKKFIDMIPDRFEYIDHLKIDAEGHDIKVLRSLDDRIQKIAAITTEQRLDYYLNKVGFKLILLQNGGYTYINNKYKHLKDDLDYLIRI